MVTLKLLTHSDREESKGRKDKINHHGAVGKLSSEQQFHKSDGITCIEFLEPYT